MIVCTQCYGSKIVNSQEGTVDVSGNTTQFAMSGPRLAETACQQCRGTGVVYS